LWPLPFGLVLFPSKIEVISLEAVNAFIDYKHDQVNHSATILAKTMPLLNHYKMHEKGAMRYCILMLHLWIISHIKTLMDIFNNFWWFDF
jgi:hypothetical protein